MNFSLLEECNCTPFTVLSDDCEMHEWELLIEFVKLFFESIDALAIKYIFESKGKPDCSEQNN